jgi:hypothetical protein
MKKGRIEGFALSHRMVVEEAVGRIVTFWELQDSFLYPSSSCNKEKE